MNRKLKVMATVSEAYKGAWSHLGEMLRLIWLPGLIYLGLSIAGSIINFEENRLLVVVINFVALLIWPILAIVWHRFILLGDAPQGGIYFNFGRREAKYLLLSVFLLLIFMPGILGMMMAGMAGDETQVMVIGILGMLLFFMSFYFFMRLTLLLPAVSVDDPVSPSLILKATRGNFWRITGVMFLSLLPLIIASMLLGIMMEAGNETVAFIVMVIVSILSIFFAVVNVAVLSIAYRELVGPAGTRLPGHDDVGF